MGGRAMSGSFRKSVLQHRIALETIWPLAFPKHDFMSLRLVQAEPIIPWPNEEAWAESVRRYHEDRKRSAPRAARSKVPPLWT
jgi:hypothetical protein